MEQMITYQHDVDAKGNPDGGWTQGHGLAIRWQKGPLGTGKKRKMPNGCFVETVILAAINRLEFYQKSKFKCPENSEAIRRLHQAHHELFGRTLRRINKGTEGTHKV